MYQAIIFDLDGTLLNTLDDLADAMNRTLLQAGFPTHPADAYRYFVGNGAKMLVTRALPETERDAETIVHWLRVFRADYQAHWKVKTRPYPGISDMLDALNARGLPLAVLSNKPEADAQRCVRELLPHWRFTMVVGQRDHVPHKPDPTGALEIAQTLHIAPADILYLGDSSVDMDTAVAAGMFPVGVLWGFRTREELVQHGARALLAQPIEVLDLLAG